VLHVGCPVNCRCFALLGTPPYQGAKRLSSALRSHTGRTDQLDRKSCQHEQPLQRVRSRTQQLPLAQLYPECTCNNAMLVNANPPSLQQLKAAEHRALSTKTWHATNVGPTATWSPNTLNHWPGLQPLSPYGRIPTFTRGGRGLGSVFTRLGCAFTSVGSISDYRSGGPGVPRGCNVGNLHRPTSLTS
jgi:hypothetical protein